MYRFGFQNSPPVDETLNNRHLGLLELFFGVTASGVGKVDGMSDLDVIGEGNVFHLNAAAITISTLMLHKCPPSSLLGIPLSEELHFRAKLGDILGECCGHFLKILETAVGGVGLVTGMVSKEGRRRAQ